MPGLPISPAHSEAAHDTFLPPAPLDRRDVAVAALLAACVVAMFWKILFTPWMLYFRDVFNYTYPHAKFIHNVCRQGLLPYWNPYLNYGQPVLANPNFLFFYPYTLLIIVAPVDLAYGLFYPLHFALAGIGTYLLARRWGQSRMAAFFAGAIFSLSGPVLSLGSLYNHTAAVAWMPWALWVTDYAVESRGARPWILLTSIFALQFLAGEPFTLIASFALSVAYALWRLGNSGSALWRARLQVLGKFFFCGALMVALCAVQFLPSANFLSHSRRGSIGLRFGDTAHWPFHPLSLLDMLFPRFFGSGLETLNPWGWMLADYDAPYFVGVFVGFIPFFFALAGWALGSDRRRRFAAGSLLVFLLLAFGRHTPVFSLTYLLVPLLELLRFPVKLVLPALMLMALLAGWGFDALRGEPRVWQARRKLIVPLEWLLGLAVAILAFSFLVPGVLGAPVRWALQQTGSSPGEAAGMAGYVVAMFKVHFPGLTGFALGGLLLLGGLERRKPLARRALPVALLYGLGLMAYVNYDLNPAVPKRFFTFRPLALSYFRGAPGSYRFESSMMIPPPGKVSEFDSFVNFQSFPEAQGIPDFAYGAFRDRWLLSAGSMLNDVEGSLNVDIEHSLPRFAHDLWIYILRQAPDATHADCLLGRTNVKYIIQSPQRESSVVRRIAEIPNGTPVPSVLYEDSCFVPRAYVAGTTLFAVNPLETFTTLASPEFDALHTVILDALPGSTPALHEGAFSAQVESLESKFDEVTVRATLDRPGYVVLLDRYDENWHVAVDGREVPLLRANQLFRTVYVWPGAHQIRFYYRQWGLGAGAVISLVTLVLLGVLFVVNPLRPRRA